MSTQFESSPGFRSDVGAAIATALGLGATLGSSLGAWLAATLGAVDGAAALGAADEPGLDVQAAAITPTDTSSDRRLE